VLITGFLGGASLTGSFVAYGRWDVLTAVIGQPKHLSRIRALLELV